MLFRSVVSPWLFGIGLVFLVLLSVLLIRTCWRYLRSVFSRVTRIFSGQPDPGAEPAFKWGRKKNVAPVSPISAQTSTSDGPPHV